MATNKDDLKDALEEFSECVKAETDNRDRALDDIKFSRLSQQWDDAAKQQRDLDGRPCLTINKLPSFIRQVVNDGRQNKPAIKVHPADDVADPQTAEVINGLIRNIEYTSGADVAYDTGLEFAVTGGFGYWRVAIEYAHDDTFDKDLLIQRVANPFSIYGDPYSTAADSSDWMRAFVTDCMTKKKFLAKYKGAELSSWEGDGYGELTEEWKNGDDVIIAERWIRDEVKEKIVQLTNGKVVKVDWLMAAVDGLPGVTNKDVLAAQGITVVEGRERETRGYKVRQQIMSGAEILETNDWAGRYIPIVPIYGEEINVEGKRYFRSMIHDAIDAQRNFNYWRTASTELVALAPKAPWLGPKGAFVTDADKWATANTKSHQFIEYDGQTAPQRVAFTGPPAGALQEALNASDDMKAVMGLYDASLGARSNETSGVAINARKREGDTSTFHFIDNQARAIKHTGVVLIDLIPHVFSGERVVRVMGIDKKPSNVRINAQQQPGQQQAGAAPAPIYDLTAGKYDLTVDTGPGFQTKREEAAYGMTELMRALPASAAVIGPHLAKAQDWPGAEEIGEELAALAPGANGQNPAVLQAQEQIKQIGAQLQQTQQAAQQMEQQLKDKSIEQAQAKEGLELDAYKAHTDRIKALGVTLTPEAAAAMGLQTAQSASQALADTLPGDAPSESMEAAATDPEASQAPAMPDMAAVMEEMRQLRQMMSAPRKRTLVRGEDGRASHAIDEIVMPEQGDPAPEGSEGGAP